MSSIVYLEALMCSPPEAGVNTVEVQNIPYYQTHLFNYECLSGFEYFEDTASECLADGNWSLTQLPICTRKQVVSIKK